MLNYYHDFPQYISNSTLGAFYNALYCIEDTHPNLQKIFDFGSLVDAMLTDQESLNFKKRWMAEPSTGNQIPFSAFDWEKGREMAGAASADPIVQQLMTGARFQHIFLRRAFKYTWGGDTVTMPSRMKLDILNKPLKLAGDVKTTACTTQESFVESINHFKYHRQGAFYLDGAEVDRFWFIGIGKKKAKNGKHPVFKYAIDRESEMYQKGFAQYNKLGYLYKHLIYDLQINNLTIQI